jgi:hypothetical protein
MLNAHAMDGSGLVTRGQFTIQFLGPAWDALENDQLLDMLQGQNTLRAPKYMFFKQ